MKKYISSIASITLMGAFLFGIVAVAEANHQWGTYHWARTSNPFTLKAVDSVTASWDSYLNMTISDWSVSAVLDVVKENGSTSNTDRRRCSPTAGKIHVCNNTYGNNGWLGIASIWANGDHITQGTTKLNDTYFNTTTYNTSAWRNLVMCQEVGHTLGLDHQDENFTNGNLETCMDYTNNPATNQHPNAHDYAQLEAMYAHLDTSTTIAAALPTGKANDVDTTDPKEWGKTVRESRDGRLSVYERDFGNGEKLITHVYWVEGNERGARAER